MQNLPAENKTNPVITMDGAKGMVPGNFDGLWRMSCIFSDSGLMPKGLQKKESVFVAIQMGLEVGLSPMQAVQNIAVINGRPSIWGDSVLALVRASGLLESFKEEITGDIRQGDCKATCTAKRKGDEAATVREFSQDDAKIAGLLSKDGPWRQYPKRMLQMRARSWALRDAFSDVLKGMRMTEEQMDSNDAMTLRQNDLGQYETSGQYETDTTDADMSMYGGGHHASQTPPRTLPPGTTTEANQDTSQTDQKVKVAPDGGTETVTETTTEKTEPQVWDPRTAELMGKYYPDKRAAVFKAANEMGVQTENRTPKEVHADIIALNKQLEGRDLPEQGDPPPVDQGTDDSGQPSTRDQFLDVLAEQGIADEEIGDINAYVHHVVKQTGGSPKDTMESAIKNPAEFIKFYRNLKSNPMTESSEPGHELPADAADREELENQLITLRHKNDARYSAIVKARIREDLLPGTMLQEWTVEQIQSVIDEFNAVDEKF